MRVYVYMYICIYIYIRGRAAYLHWYLRIITYKRVILSYTPALLMIIKTPRSILFALEYFLKFSPDNGAPPPPRLCLRCLCLHRSETRVLGLPGGAEGEIRREISPRIELLLLLLDSFADLLNTCCSEQLVPSKRRSRGILFGTDKYSRGQLTCNNAITRIQLYYAIVTGITGQ